MEKQLLSNHGETIEEVIAKQLCVHIIDVTPTASLKNDLGADSLDSVELCMKLEREFDVAINDTEWEKVSTVQDVINLMVAIQL